ncbi:MAG TPA: signal peptidase I [Acidimicrobiales bacterium]|nr:signal peptidase I [Acidimicrobiales bacterium]
MTDTSAPADAGAAGMPPDESPGRDILAGPAEEPLATRSLKSTIEWILIIVAALAFAFVIKTFLIQAFYIPSASMEPTLDIGERVLVNKLSYKLHDVHRGDVVVFERPDGQEGTSQIKDLIKRVVALGGETVETRDGHIYVDGKPLAENYLPAGEPPGPPVDKLRVPEGHLWVMGDNRGNSKDSRVFGPISENLLVGRAFVRIWPLGRFKFSF